MDIENKFIFTDEGHRLLISQDGGIRLAILGGILIQGLEPVDVADFLDTYRGLTLDDLRNDSIVLGLAGVHYTHTPGTQNVTPSDKSAYEDAITDKNITKHLFGTFYLPSREVVSNNGTSYGTYEFTYDKTSLACDFDKSSNDSASFPIVAIIGKQYAETNDATFNVNETQMPIIVGVAQIAGKYDEDTSTFTGGIQFLGNQAEYIRTDLRIQFALTDDDRDVSEIAISGSEDYLDMVSKLSLVNDGLRTDSSVNLVPDSELSLSEEGSIATPKSLMLADPYRSDELENQWNAAARLHIVNKKSEAGDAPTYREQVVLSTINVPDDLNSAELTAHHMGMMLNGGGDNITATTITAGNNVSITYEGSASPAYRQGENPTYAVDLYGLDNTVIGEGNDDKFTFASGNVSIVSGESSGSNVIIGSSDNYMMAGKDNMLLQSDNNILSGMNDKFATGNIIMESDNNILRNRVNPGQYATYENASGNVLIGTSGNNIAASRNIIIGGEDNKFKGLDDCIFIGAAGVITDASKQHCIILGNYPDIKNNRTTPDNSLIYGNGTSDTDKRNALVFTPAIASMAMSGRTVNGDDIENTTATYYSGGFSAVSVSSNSQAGFATLTPYNLTICSGTPANSGQFIAIGNGSMTFHNSESEAGLGITGEDNASYLWTNQSFKTWGNIKSENIVSAKNGVYIGNFIGGNGIALAYDGSKYNIHVTTGDAIINGNIFNHNITAYQNISAGNGIYGVHVNVNGRVYAGQEVSSPYISASRLTVTSATNDDTADFTCPATFNGPVSSYNSLTVSSTQDTSAFCGLNTPRICSLTRDLDLREPENDDSYHKGDRIIIYGFDKTVTYKYNSNYSYKLKFPSASPMAVEFIRWMDGKSWLIPFCSGSTPL